MLYEYEFYEGSFANDPMVLMSAELPLPQIETGNRLILDSQMQSTRTGCCREIRDILVHLVCVSGSTPTRMKTMVLLGAEEEIR